MGEAKRRKASGQQTVGSAEMKPGELRWATKDDPSVQAIFETAGEPISVAMVGAGLIVPSVASMPFDEFIKPQHRALRLAFGVFDRIRLGEMEGCCGLCGARHSVSGFSCYAVAERARGTSRKKPAIVMPVCHQCDSISTDETRRRVMAMLPVAAVGIEAEHGGMH